MGIPAPAIVGKPVLTTNVEPPDVTVVLVAVGFDETIDGKLVDPVALVVEAALVVLAALDVVADVEEVVAVVCVAVARSGTDVSCCAAESETTAKAAMARIHCLETMARCVVL